MSRIKIKQLSISYGNHQVLKNVSLDIPDRQIIAVIGPSGCGKTTLLKSMNRLLDLNEDVAVKGEIFIDGENIYRPDIDVTDLRKRVGFLPQHPYPLPMSIFDNVAFGPKIHGLDISSTPAVSGTKNEIGKKDGMRMFVEHYLRLAGLWEEVKDRLHSPAAKLSIGQQQRLALARVLSIEPEIILADEPTGNLDTESGREIVELFRGLHSEGRTLVVVTHEAEIADRAERVVVLRDGKIQEERLGVG